MAITLFEGREMFAVLDTETGQLVRAGFFGQQVWEDREYPDELAATNDDYAVVTVEAAASLEEVA